MKICQLLDSPSIILTNEESEFVSKYSTSVPIRSLVDRDEVLARNLVRKGVYEISNDSKNIVLKKDATIRKNPI